MHYTEVLSGLKWEHLPRNVQHQAKRCLADILATAAGALLLPIAPKGQALVKHQYGRGNVPLWFRGDTTTFLGAAFYNALAVDSLDFHDGFRPCKGHAGATVTPVVLGACADRPISGKTLLTALVIGYEVACRAGMALHSLYSPAYHASGSWASLGAAAAAAYLMDVPAHDIDGILGIAEYYSPVSPMLRCTGHPGAVKDGAAAGAWAAATAIAMYSAQMPGIPSLLTSEAVGRQHLDSLGSEWLICQQYFKAYPTCRWTQPAVECVRHLQHDYRFDHTDITSITLEMFEEGVTLGRKRYPPQNSDDAQYNIAWAVAALLVDGALGIDQILPETLSKKEIIDLGRRVKTVAVPDIQKRFPAECLSRVVIALKDGRTLKSPTLGARGDYTNPLSDEELEQKFDSLVCRALGKDPCRRLKSILTGLEEYSAHDLLRLLSEKPQ